MAGYFSTSREAEITLKIPEINVMAYISAPFHVTTTKNNYNIIFGRDLLWELGIQLDFQNDLIAWKDINLPMKPMDCKMKTCFTIQDSKNVRNAIKKIKKVLDDNYKIADLKKIVNNLKYFSQSFIPKLLAKHEEMFDNALGNYTDSEYKIELLEGAKPYHTKSFPIPKIHEETFKTEVNLIINIGIL